MEICTNSVYSGILYISRRVILSSEDEDDDTWSGSPIRPTPQSTLRSSPQPTPSNLRSVLTSPLAPSTLRSVLTPPLAPSNLRSAQTLPPPLSTLRSSLSLPPSSRPTLPPPLGNLRWPDVSTSHHVTTSPATPRRPIRDNMFVRILTLLEETKETQKIQGRMLQTLLQQRGNIGTIISSTPEGFPLKTINDLEIMEEKLANPNFMSKLVCMLSLVVQLNYILLGEIGRASCRERV